MQLANEFLPLKTQQQQQRRRLKNHNKITIIIKKSKKVVKQPEQCGTAISPHYNYILHARSAGIATEQIGLAWFGRC